MSLYANKNAYSFTVVDKKKWTEIKISIQDKEGNLYSIEEVADNLVKYFKKESEREDSTIVKQIFPALTQMMFPNLATLYGEDAARMLVNGELIRSSILDSMTLSFLFLKYIQQKELQIVSESRPLIKNEIEIIKNNEEAARNSGPINQLLGVSPQELLRSLYNSGQISLDDLVNLERNSSD